MASGPGLPSDWLNTNAKTGTVSAFVPENQNSTRINSLVYIVHIIIDIIIHVH